MFKLPYVQLISFDVGRAVITKTAMYSALLFKVLLKLFSQICPGELWWAHAFTFIETVLTKILNMDCRNWVTSQTWWKWNMHDQMPRELGEQLQIHSAQKAFFILELWRYELLHMVCNGMKKGPSNYWQQKPM